MKMETYNLQCELVVRTYFTAKIDIPADAGGYTSTEWEKFLTNKILTEDVYDAEWHTTRNQTVERLNWNVEKVYEDGEDDS
jgi:hypothetical protein